MKKFLEQLKPQERRWVIGLAAGTFLLINYLFVWPHFKDWREADVRKQKAEEKLSKFRAEIARRPEYERLIKKYETEGGGAVAQEEQMEQFVTFVQNLANLYSVNIINNSPPRTSTNSPFFIDREMSFTVLAREDGLVNFLYALGSSNSVMRVRAMSLRPDGPHQQLSANITVLASYQKKAPAPAAPVKTNTPAAKPVAPLDGPKRTNAPPASVPGKLPGKGSPNAKTP
jgi:hypothetical protein